MKPSSALVGRASDRAAIERRLFEEDARLLTLLGPPGIGKTALAGAIAAEHEGPFVLLDGVSEGSAACDRIVVACGRPSADFAADEVERTAAVLRDLGDRVVVLDAITPALAQLVDALLTRAPEIAFVATARERLAIEGEVVHEVGPLDTTGSEAAELLVAAARRAAHGYAPRPEDVPHLVAIGRALEGIPLALELAGARLPLVGAALLAREPPSPLDAVVERTVRALEPRLRETLACLAVFASGFDLVSAAAVLGLDVANAAAAVDALRARALVRIRDAGAGRLDLYQPVRSAAERIEPVVVAAARERHATFFVTQAEAAAARAHHDAAARAWLVGERDELMTIIERVATSARPNAESAEQALRATVALSSVLLVRGPIAAVAAIVSPLVERTRDSGADPRLAARVTALRGAIRRERGDVRAALKDLLAAESIARAVSDDLLAADILVELGRTVLAAGETVAARDHFDRAARAHAALGARASEAHASALLGATMGILGDFAGARTMLERASALVASDRIARPPILLLLARACAEMQDMNAADAALDEALALAIAERDVRTEAEALVLRGTIALAASSIDAATTALTRARDLFAANGLVVDAAIARGWLGVVARASGRSAEAYALLADARDICSRSRPARKTHAVAFGVFLAALDADVGRTDAARASLEALAVESESSWEHASPWPPPAKLMIEALRGRPAVAMHARLVMGRSSAATARPPDDALLVGAGGEWFRPPRGERVGLERRKSLALLLDRLAAVPGTSLDAPTLFAAAWPGERAIASAAAHRVRVGVATLRKMGLRELVVTTPTGYALGADVQLVRV